MVNTKLIQGPVVGGQRSSLVGLLFDYVFIKRKRLEYTLNDALVTRCLALAVWHTIDNNDECTQSADQVIRQKFSKRRSRKGGYV